MNDEGADLARTHVRKLASPEGGVQLGICGREISGVVSACSLCSTLLCVTLGLALGVRMAPSSLTAPPPANTAAACAPGARTVTKAACRTVRLKYVMAEDVAQIIFKGLGKDVNIDVETDARTNAVVLAGEPDTVDKVMTQVKNLDVRVPNVMIDASIFEVDPAHALKLGFTKLGDKSIHVAAPHRPPADVAARNDLPVTRILPEGHLHASVRALESRGLARTLSCVRFVSIRGTQALLMLGDKIMFSLGPSRIGDKITFYPAPLMIGGEITFSPGPSIAAEELGTGTIVDITPRVGKDHFITMAINVEELASLFVVGGDVPRAVRSNARTETRIEDGGEVLVRLPNHVAPGCRTGRKKARSADSGLAVLIRAWVVP